MSDPQNNPHDEHGHGPRPGEKKYWLDNPKNVDLIWYALAGACFLLFVADFFVEKHPHFPIEEWVNFYGFYGFIGCVFLVLAAAQLRKVLMRDEDYYERKSDEDGKGQQ